MYGCGEQEVGVDSGSGWNLWVWLLGVVVRRYIYFVILLIRTPLVSVLLYSSKYIKQGRITQLFDNSSVATQLHRHQQCSTYIAGEYQYRQV